MAGPTARSADQWSGCPGDVRARALKSDWPSHTKWLGLDTALWRSERAASPSALECNPGDELSEEVALNQ